MQLSRMTIRAWMITVVVAAALITAGQIGNRCRRFRALAAWHQKQADSFVITAAVSPPSIRNFVLDTGESAALRQIEESKRLWRYDFGQHRGYYRNESITAEQVAQAELELKNAEAEIEAVVTRRRHVADYHRGMSRKYQQPQHAHGNSWSQAHQNRKR
jgi:hypothetical protein